jgi:hypothetical protein
MDENPERRMYLDKLLGYMEEIRKPVTACPTISKQPLDLYRLYLYVKERGGFMEVCKVNLSEKNSSAKSAKPPSSTLSLYLSLFIYFSNSRFPSSRLLLILGYQK